VRLSFKMERPLKELWEKDERESRTTFADSKGKEISFNGGPIWIEIIPIGSEVSY